jgi:hypothetical protein
LSPTMIHDKFVVGICYAHILLLELMTFAS